MGIRVMSINLLLENADQPVVWRGPVLSGAVTQFWTDVAWGDLDVLFIDMPPGTGDVPLTIYQSLPLDGNIIVSTPQTLVQMVVSKAHKMAEMLHIPVLGIVENMSCVVCPRLRQAHSSFRRQRLSGGSRRPDGRTGAGESAPKRGHCPPVRQRRNRTRRMREMDPAVDAVEQLLKN